MEYKVLSVVIPVYNEEKFITTTIRRVIFAECNHLQKEIVIVDDHSKDATVQKIKTYLSELHKDTSGSELKSSEKNMTVFTSPKLSIKLIEKEKNGGKGTAMKLGFGHTTGDIVIVQDADLEYLPEEFPLLLEPFIEHNAEVVYGSRFISNRPHRVLYFWHYAANMFLTTLSNVFTNLNLTDMETGYKVFRGELIRTIAPKLECERFGFEPEITARIAKIKNLQIYEVGVSYYGRTYDEGKKIGWKDGVRAIAEIIKYNLFRS